MQVTWRFFIGDDMRWRWQRLSTDRAVLSESPLSYDDYECCIEAARSAGYIFQAAQENLVRPGSGRQRRR